jgi:response regulator of citrate/malate metabolism
MRVMFISLDDAFVIQFKHNRLFADEQLLVYNESNDPLDIMSAVCSYQPGFLILDDDFVQPNSVKILKSIRHVNHQVKIIFITSDTSIYLGRDVMPMGIYYYGIKPFNDEDLKGLINSVIAISNM